MHVPDDLLYSSDHEWVRLEGVRATIGITDYAQDALGDVVYVQLPVTGVGVTSGATFCEVESTKSVSDVYAPVSGTVVEVNGTLVDQPDQLNSNPYGTGWVCVIEITEPGELDTLMDAAAYRALIEH
jgi:glycine cleavage system H protein